MACSTKRSSDDLPSRPSSSNSWHLVERAGPGGRNWDTQHDTSDPQSSTTNNIPDGQSFHSRFSQPMPITRPRADILRDDVCFSRIDADRQRDRLVALCAHLENTTQDQINFFDMNSPIDAAPDSTLKQLHNLKSEMAIAREALLKQCQSTREAEARLRETEAQIAGLGLWFVHIPQSSI